MLSVHTILEICKAPTLRLKEVIVSISPPSVCCPSPLPPPPTYPSVVHLHPPPIRLLSVFTPHLPVPHTHTHLSVCGPSSSPPPPPPPVCCPSSARSVVRLVSVFAHPHPTYCCPSSAHPHTSCCPFHPSHSNNLCVVRQLTARRPSLGGTVTSGPFDASPVTHTSTGT